MAQILVEATEKFLSPYIWTLKYTSHSRTSNHQPQIKKKICIEIQCFSVIFYIISFLPQLGEKMKSGNYCYHIIIGVKLQRKLNTWVWPRLNASVKVRHTCNKEQLCILISSASLHFLHRTLFYYYYLFTLHVSV